MRPKQATFNGDIVNSSTICNGKPFKTTVEWVQCIGRAERPVISNDLPNLLGAYDSWHSVRLSAANDYDNQVRLVRDQANATMRPQIDAKKKKFYQAVTGIWPRAQMDRDLIKQELQSASSRCIAEDGIYKSVSMVVNFKCDRDTRGPVFERRVPAATSALRKFYNEELAIGSEYDKAVLPALQAADVQFKMTFAPAKSGFQSQIQLAIQNEAAATARQHQEINDDAATLLMLLGAGLSGFNQGRGYDQPSHPPLATSCTTTNGITNCLSL